jgi:hypothetical protein
MNKIVTYPKIATPVARAIPKEAPSAASPTNLAPENHAARIGPANRATHPMAMRTAWRTSAAVRPPRRR